MTHDEMIAVIQAHKEGKTIQIFPTANSKLGWKDWKGSENPIWDFNTYKYRIKPEPHYRPFKSAEEVMEAIKEHGNYTKYNGVNAFYIIQIIGINCLTIRDDNYRFDEALKKFIFADGTPFGIKED